MANYTAHTPDVAVGLATLPSSYRPKNLYENMANDSMAEILPELNGVNGREPRCTTHFI